MIGARKLLVPKPGLKIRDPGARGKPLPAAGRVVVIDAFWQRRIVDGDVEVSDPPVRAKPAPDEAPAVEAEAAPEPPPAAEAEPTTNPEP